MHIQSLCTGYSVKSASSGCTAGVFKFCQKGRSNQILIFIAVCNGLLLYCVNKLRSAHAQFVRLWRACNPMRISADFSEQEARRDKRPVSFYSR